MARISSALIACLRSSVFLFAMTQTLAPKPSAAQQPGDQPKRITNVRWHGSLTPYQMASGIWRVDHTFQSNVRIKNIVENAPLSVTPVLFMADGTEYDLPAAELSPAGIATVNVNEALDAAPAAIRSHLSDFGSFSLRYRWYWAGAIMGQIENLDVRRSLVYVHPFGLVRPLPHQKPEQQQIEGMWWKRDAGVGGFVALVNPSDSAVKVAVVASDAQGRVGQKEMLSLAAHNSKMLDLADVLAGLPQESREGGVHISYQGTPETLMIFGGLENSRTGYSARMPFSRGEPTVAGMASMSRVITTATADTQTPAAQPDSSLFTLAAVGVMTGMPDPMMMFPTGTQFFPYATLRNTSHRTLTIQPTVYYMQSGGPKSAPLARQILLPGEARQLALPRLLSGAGLGNFSGEINLVFSFAGELQDLLLAAGSVDQTGNYVFEVDTEVPSPSSSKTLSYWNAADGTDTMFSIWNHGDTAEDLVLTLFYKNGSYKYPIHLEPKASAMLNISEIIQAHKPDAEGNVIPFFIRQGSAKISGPNGEIDTINATVGISTFNVRTKTCALRCTACNGATSIFDDPSPFSATMGASMQLKATAQYNNGTQYDVTAQSAWSSNNTAVATVSGGLVQALAPGPVTIVTVDGFQVNSEVCSWTVPPPCPRTNLQAQAPGEVGPPRIDSIDPDVVMIGSNNVQLTITGAGFGASPTVNLPQGFTNQGSGGNSDTRIVVTVNIGFNADIGNNTISVTVNNKGSNPEDFTVDGPNEAIVQSDQIRQSSFSANVQSRFVTYQVMNFSGSQAQGIPIAEAITFNGYNCNQPDPGHLTAQCDATFHTDGTGTFTDEWSMYTQFTPAGCGVNITDFWQWCGPSAPAPNPGITFMTLIGFNHTADSGINGFINPPQPIPAGQVFQAH